MRTIDDSNRNLHDYHISQLVEEIVHNVFLRANPELQRQEQEAVSFIKKHSGSLKEMPSPETNGRLAQKFMELGAINSKLGELHNEPQHYTDSAILYNYALSILREKETKYTQVEKEGFIEEIYLGLSKLKQHLLAGIGYGREEERGGGMCIEDTQHKMKHEILNNRSDISDLRLYVEQEINALDLRLQEMRNSSENADRTQQKQFFIDNTQRIYSHINHHMQGFLAKLYQKSQDEIGKPPCDYAVIGLGSMALNQMTPYSDLEFAILVEKNSPEITQYFKNLTHLVNFKVINLGETPIPYSKYQLSLDHLIHIGINLDLGGKTPLGRSDKPYVLIQTPEDMAKYLDIKYAHLDKLLPNVLEAVLHVHGYNDLTAQYQARAFQYLTANNESKSCIANHQARAIQRLKDGIEEIDYLGTGNSRSLQGNLDNFVPKLGVDDVGKLFKIKYDIYRLPDRLIYDFSFYHGVVPPRSPWEAIYYLKDKNIICEEACTNLSYAISFATNLRLKIYNKFKQQREDVDVRSLYDLGLCNDFLEHDSSLLSYYYSSIALHKYLTKFCNLAQFGGDALKLLENERFQNDSNLTKGTIYMRLAKYDAAVEKLKSVVFQDKTDILMYSKSLILIGYIYSFHGKFKVLNECCMRILDALKSNGCTDSTFKEIEIEARDILALAYIIQGKPHDAIQHIDSAAQLNFDDQIIAARHDYLRGLVFQKLSKPDHNKAIELFYSALDKLKLKANMNDSNVSTVERSIGESYMALEDYNEALVYFNNALKIAREAELNMSILPFHKRVVECYLHLKNYEKALQENSNLLRLYISLYGDKSQFLYEVYEQRKDIYNYLNKPYEAAKSYFMSLSVHGKKNYSLCVKYLSLAKEFMQNMKYDDSCECYNAIIQICSVSRQDDQYMQGMLEESRNSLKKAEELKFFQELESAIKNAKRLIYDSDDQKTVLQGIDILNHALLQCNTNANVQGEKKLLEDIRIIHHVMYYARIKMGDIDEAQRERQLALEAARIIFTEDQYEDYKDEIDKLGQIE